MTPLERLSRWQDVSLLLLRLATGIFLIHGVWDNIVDPARMAEFIGFLTAFDFPLPSLSAPLTVWIQLGIGIALVLGVWTRIAGLLCAATFAVGIVFIHSSDELRAIWPALALVVIGLQLATAGAGRYSVDEWLVRRRRTP